MRKIPIIIWALAIAACGGSQGPLDFEPVVEGVATPAAEGSLGPHLAAGADGVWLSFLEPDSVGYRLELARFDGTEWRRMGRVAAGTNWFVNWADVPSVEPSGDGTIWAHWLERLGEDRYAYGVRVAQSRDEGLTWSEPAWLHEDRSATEHGFVALTGDGKGGATAIWLDGAKYATGENEMQLRARDLMPDGSMGAESVVDGRTCDCCPNAAVRLADGRVVAAFRDRSTEEVRDVAIAVRTIDGTWGESKPLAPTGWRIDSCPVNGPALASDGRRVVAAWFTMVGTESRVFVAFSEDGGGSFGPEVRVDEGRAVGRVDVELLEDGSAVVAWVEATGASESPVSEADTRPAGIMARRVVADGTVSQARLLVETGESRAAGYPRLVSSGGDLLLAWTEVSPRRAVRTAVVRLRNGR